MPEITVTETQREKLTEIRSDLSEAYIDTYGEIRTKDVVQYLLDTYTPPEQQTDDVAYERIATAEFPTLQQVATEVEGVPGSGIDAETMRGELVSALGVEEFAARLDALDADSDIDEDGDASGDEESSPASDDSDGTDTSAEDDGTEDADDSADPDESDEADDDAEADDETDSDTSSTTPSAGDSADSILSAANQLLADHDDKWREGGSDEPYEVDLPDGTTKKVRTKDDIRQVLFKNY